MSAFWNFVNRFVPGTLAKAEDVNSNLDGIDNAFALVEAETDSAIKITVETGVVEIGLTAVARANKLVAFDVNGDIAASQILGDWKGNHADAAGTDYEIRDVVLDAAASLGQDNLYICNNTHTSTGSLATDTANWDLLVDAAQAMDWAMKTNGIVDAIDYSSKAYSLGGTGVTNTAGKGAAKEWATKAEDSLVDTVNYSAKHHALKAAASADFLDDRILGAFTTANEPTLDNDGGALLTGAQYFNTDLNRMKVYNGASWQLTTANAVDVAISDSGSYFAGVEVEAALQEIGAAIVVNWTSAVQIGIDLNLLTTNSTSIATLSSTEIAILDGTANTITYYSWNGNVWVKEGNSKAVGLAGALSGLTNTDIVYINDNADEIETYRWDGANWTKIGTGLALGQVTNPAVTALSSTSAAYINESSGAIKYYSWSGSAWSLVGSGFTLSSWEPAIAALNSTDIAFIDQTNLELRTYHWGGSSWSLVGTGLSFSSVGSPSLTALNETDVVVSNANNDLLGVYRWNGSVWLQIGSDTYVNSTNAVISAINGTDIAFVDTVIEDLKTYRFGFSIGQ